MKNFKKVFTSFIIAIVLFAGSSQTIHAQSSDDDVTRNRIRVSYGDALYFGFGSIVADAIVSPILGAADDYDVPGAFTVSYRRLLTGDRFALGGNFSYIPVTVTRKSGKTDLSVFTITAAVDCYYIKSGLFRLYGTANAGAGFSSEDGGFVFQVNPLAARVGNNKIAGFVEAGIGTQGIFNLGIEFGF